MLLTPSQIGLIITLFPLVMAVVAPISGYLSDRISPIILTSCGLSITAASLMFLSSLGTSTVICQIGVAQAALGLALAYFRLQTIIVS